MSAYQGENVRGGRDAPSRAAATKRSTHLANRGRVGQSIRIERELFWQNLQGDVTIQLDVVRAIDLSHSACAQRREDLVGAEASAGGEGQRSNQLRITLSWRGTDSGSR